MFAGTSMILGKLFARLRGACVALIEGHLGLGIFALTQFAAATESLEVGVFFGLGVALVVGVRAEVYSEVVELPQRRCAGLVCVDQDLIIA